MPFTPCHMGPGILVKALLQGSFSLMVFGWTQMIMDIQPLVALLSGERHLHGFSHTYIGVTLIGLGSALTGKYVAEFGLRLIDQRRHLPIGWSVAIISALIGSYTHVLLDSLMHADLAPFAPFSAINSFLHIVSVEALYKFCLYSGIFGAALYFAIAHWASKHNSSFNPVLICQIACVVLFLVSICLPAIAYHSATDYGFVLLLVGWLGLLDNYYPWLANPLWAATLALTHWRPGIAIVSGLLSLAFALSTTFFRRVPDDSGYQTIHQFEIGFFLWVLSSLLATIAAVIAWSKRNNDVNQKRRAAYL